MKRFSLTCAAWFVVAMAMLLALTLPAYSQTIETIAGTGRPEDGPAEGPALSTNVGDPFGVEIGPDGALYICEVRNHRVRRLATAVRRRRRSSMSPTKSGSTKRATCCLSR